MIFALHDWVFIYLILITGATLQGLIGFGLGLFSAPFLFLLAPDLVPVPMILNALVITFVLLVSERKFVDRHLAPFSVVGGTLGVILAAVIISTIDWAYYQILFGVSIVTAVIISLAGFAPQVSSLSSAIAGTLSGFMGTLTSAGGAPMGLLYQTSNQEKIRANLSLFFVYINFLSIASLSIGGMVSKQDLQLFLYSLPAVAIGWIISLYLQPYINVNVIRPLILFIAFFSGLMCIFF